LFLVVFRIYFHGPFLDQGILQFALSPGSKHGVLGITELLQVSLVLTDDLVERTELLLKSLTQSIREGLALQGKGRDAPHSKELAQLYLAELGHHEEVHSNLTT